MASSDRARGAALALVESTPHVLAADDPKTIDLEEALRDHPAAKDAFRILLAHRPGAFDGAALGHSASRWPATFTAGSSICRLIGWSRPADHKYVMGHFTRAPVSSVSRGIGVVGVPLRVLCRGVALFELPGRSSGVWGVQSRV